MSPEDSVRFYEQQQAYRHRREEFNEDIVRWFQNFKPKYTQCHDTLNQRTPEKKTADCSPL